MSRTTDMTRVGMLWLLDFYINLNRTWQALRQAHSFALAKHLLEPPQPIPHITESAEEQATFCLIGFRTVVGSVNSYENPFFVSARRLFLTPFSPAYERKDPVLKQELDLCHLPNIVSVQVLLDLNSSN